MSSQQSYPLFLTQVKAQLEIWILVDEHGCMLLNDEDEDCVPIWANKKDALVWATGDWQACQAKSISIQDWLNKWSIGLSDDDVCIAVNPAIGEKSLVLFPDIFDQDLRTK